jgi:hypothetical protein
VVEFLSNLKATLWDHRFNAYKTKKKETYFAVQTNTANEAPEMKIGIQTQKSSLPQHAE